MAPSRTFGEQTVLEQGRGGTGKRDGFFEPAAKSPATTLSTVVRTSKTVDARAVRGHHRRIARRAPDRIRQGHAARPLSAARRELPGSVRARRRGLCRRRRHAQRVYDYISKLWFMPATPVLSQRRHRPRPADQLLSEQRLRQPRRHRRHLERECLAGVQGRRHRHLLGQRPRHRRAGRPQRQDQRHHPVRAGDGQPDAGDFAGLAAARLGRLLPRHLAPRDRGVPRDPQAVGRLQPQGAEPPPRRARHRRVHGGGARRRRVRPAQSPKDGSRCAPRSTPARCSRSWSRPASRPASRTSSSSTR